MVMVPISCGLDAGLSHWGRIDCWFEIWCSGHHEVGGLGKRLWGLVIRSVALHSRVSS